ncbi:hypothetical protein TNCT_617681 [Trichonephila clavata]|uniref:Uncharacterized protein n=1 Tax=Trichonephila clavata TaxID=2740835 RepID=A0A8X6GV38_TRICU|nr:hypothetical protein TNCT_617681 [Trichonephila clavata]
MSVAYKNGVEHRRKGPLIVVTHRSFDWEGEKGVLHGTVDQDIIKERREPDHNGFSSHATSGPTKDARPVCMYSMHYSSLRRGVSALVESKKEGRLLCIEG